jgi:hypothetical protein
MKSTFVLTHDVPGKQLLVQLQAQVQGLWTLCRGKGARTYSPSGACSSCLARTLGRKHINAGADGMLECADGTSSGADDIFGYIYVYSTSADVCAAGADGNDSCSDGHGRNVNGRERNINGRGRNVNGRGQYRNGREREKNRRPWNHDGRGRNHNGRGLEKCWLLRGSMRTQYNNFLQDMHLQEENIIEKQKSKRKKLVVSGRIYLLIFIQKICNTFS